MNTTTCSYVHEDLLGSFYRGELKSREFLCKEADPVRFLISCHHPLGPSINVIYFELPDGRKLQSLDFAVEPASNYIALRYVL